MSSIELKVYSDVTLSPENSDVYFLGEKTERYPQVEMLDLGRVENPEEDIVLGILKKNHKTENAVIIKLGERIFACVRDQNRYIPKALLDPSYMGDDAEFLKELRGFANKDRPVIETTPTPTIKQPKDPQGHLCASARAHWKGTLQAIRNAAAKPIPVRGLTPIKLKP